MRAMNERTKKEQKGSTFMRVEKQGTHYIAVFREHHGLSYMDRNTLKKRITVLKEFGMDASEGEFALKELEKESK